MLNFDPRLPGLAQLALNFLLGLGAAALPVSVAMAILRYRLYDIDRIISRTVSYAIVTGVLVGVYAGLVLLATGVLPVSCSIAVAGATLAAALRPAGYPWVPDGGRQCALSWPAAGGYAAVVADPLVLSRFAAGDEDAVRTIYRTYGRLVFAVAYKVLGDRELAEDATQQAFLQAWRAAATFEPSKELGPWLATIARRAAIDVHRREARHAHRGADAKVTIQSEGPVEVMRVSAKHLPPNTDFDLFVTQVPNAPFGISWYQGDLESDSSGHANGTFIGRFSVETFAVAPGAAPAPAVFNGPFPDATLNPPFNPVQMYHLGLWFNSPKDAVAAGCAAATTPFNGEHDAGVQALSTRNFPNQAGPLRQVSS